MVFTSTIFIFIFLPIVLFSMFLIKSKYRDMLLLIASLIFYIWGGPQYIITIFISILINYCFGLLIKSSQDSKQRKKILIILAIAFNLGMLIIFKYGNFFVSNFNNVFKFMGMNTNIIIPKIALPLGISFFTFQGLSYVIDVYRGKAEVQKSIIKVALYLSLFPKLTQGPIIKYADIEKEINCREITLDGLYIGLRRFIIGFAKKMLIANELGIIADKIFAIQGSDLTTLITWIGIICYTLQIYYDFSGYSDMAIGLGRALGFNFTENFNYPYISQSIKEFWSRWHISLTSWFREYLYFPLGGNKCSKIRSYTNQMIVFALSGLWHGANWTFLFWGIYHGAFLVIEKIEAGRITNKIWWPLRNVYAILVIMIGWVFFRADNISYAVQYIRNMFIYKPSTNLYYPSLYIDNKVALILIIAIVFATPITKFCKKRMNTISNLTIKYILISISDFGGILLFVLSLIVLSSTTYNPFIYFKF